MRYVYASVMAGALICLAPAAAAAQGSLDGFGGLSINRIGTFDGSSVPVDFGGRLAVDLGSRVQAIGEVGRMGNMLPGPADLLLSFTPVDVRVRAWYGEGGFRLLGSPRSAVSPYLEGTAGVARLDLSLSGVSPAVNTATRLAFSLLDRTEPLVSAGGGVLVRSGPIEVDLGYRYKQILANDVVATFVGAGQGLRAHQVRFGLGVRF